MIFISSSSTSDSARLRRQLRSSSACFSSGSRSRYCASAFTRSASFIAAVPPDRRSDPLDRLHEERFELRPLLPQHLPVVRGELALDQRFDDAAPVAPGVVFLQHAESLHAAQDHVVAAVAQALEMRDDPAAADRIHRRAPFVVVLPARFEQHHADHVIAAQRVSHHVAIALLEDMQRQKDIREEDDARQRKQREQISHAATPHRSIAPHFAPPHRAPPHCSQ